MARPPNFPSTTLRAVPLPTLRVGRILMRQMRSFAAERVASMKCQPAQARLAQEMKRA
ncbi:hypothetical protein BV95_02110 [Sphingobium chlorophenolicum]|uniref:Uncharacterized protein n=1 Tax=Sphingobium chlorophenolicum TaxID=46429 RepID=A0A081REA6_SPHCR|nr:hypothetical protein BV95_02110 [Sphingobium chlorophenolicum]